MISQFLREKRSGKQDGAEQKKLPKQQALGIERIVTLRQSRRKKVINKFAKTCKELCFSEEDEESLFTFDYRRR